mmetsp:Transcript_21722/g.19149  ORF Transcript_21722/g.19149 Transcript_21722/m.19149 type:complete len:880 (-) Transcript_21722:217-2856(-)
MDFWVLLVLLFTSTQSQRQDGYCIDAGSDTPHNGLSGTWEYKGDENGKPSYKQISCTDPQYINNCDITGTAERKLEYLSQFGDGLDRWSLFGLWNGGNFGISAPCEDSQQPEQPELCEKWSQFSAGFPKFTPGSCSNSDTSTTTSTTKPPGTSTTESSTTSTTASGPATRKFTVNNDPNQHIQIKENTAWINSATDLLECGLKDDDTPKYIIMNINEYNKIKGKNVLIMRSDVFDDAALKAECKFPVLKVLDSPQPETLPNNEIKIFVTTGVSMTDYIEDIDVDLSEIEMELLDPDQVSVPSEEHLPTATADDSMEWDESSFEIEAAEYSIQCVDNCQDFDGDKYFGDYVASDYRDTLLKEKEAGLYRYVSKHAQQYPADTRRRLESLESEWTLSSNPRRRRLGWGNPFKAIVKWVKKKIIKPIVRIVKLVIQIIKGDVNYTKDFGIDEDIKKSKTFKSKYKRKKSASKAVVDGKIELEYGIKFVLKLEAKLRAKWTLTPPKFEQFRISIKGSTEFLAWFKAKLTAEANVDMEIFKREKSFKFFIGPVPVIVTLTGRVDFNLNSEIELKFMQQFGYESMSVEVGMEYINGGWSAIRNDKLDFKPIFTTDIAFNGGDGDESGIECPIGQEIKATLTPRFTVSFYKLVHASLEKDLALVNTFEIGDSCVDNINTCNILANPSDHVLGISTNLDLDSPDLRLVLGVGIDILGIDLKWQHEIPIGGTSFKKENIVEECFDLPAVVDTALKAVCKDDCAKEEYRYVCIDGITENSFTFINGEYKAIAVGTYEYANGKYKESRPYNEESDDCRKVWCIYHDSDGDTYLGAGGIYAGKSDLDNWTIWKYLPELMAGNGNWIYNLNVNDGTVVHNPGDLGRLYAKKR